MICDFQKARLQKIRTNAIPLDQADVFIGGNAVNSGYQLEVIGAYLEQTGRTEIGKKMREHAASIVKLGRFLIGEPS